jgi:cytidylate kinase
LAPEAAKNVERQVSQRDAQDAKVVDFMSPAPGVKLVDSTELNFEQTVSAVLEATR